MESEKIVKQCTLFLEKYCKKDTANPVVNISFFDIVAFDTALAEELEEKPEEVFRALELSTEPALGEEKNILVTDFPPSFDMLIRNIRNKHTDRMLTITGIVKRKTDVRPQVTMITFECKYCGKVTSEFQAENRIRMPTQCVCTRKDGMPAREDKRGWREINKRMVDGYAMVIEELTDQIKAGSDLKKLNCFVSGILAEPSYEQKVFPGTRVKIAGILKTIYQENKSGSKRPYLDYIFHIKNIEVLDTDLQDLVLTKEDEQEIRDIANMGDVLTQLSSVFSDIEGYDEIKKGLILQIVGGEPQQTKRGTKTRGDLHVLVIGDPGTSKSTMGIIAYINAPKSRYVTGRGASGVGLTASVVKDEILGGYALEAGALPLAHHGLLVVDEFDKLHKGESDALHEALEQQTISISKANIQATLRCETSLLACANPKFGRFEDTENPLSQIDLPPALISRFDLIFCIRDVADKEKDMSTAMKMLTRVETDASPLMTTELFKKYILFAKRFHPVVPIEIKKYIAEFFTNVRDLARSKGTTGLTARFVEIIRRLSEAHAKLNLREIVTREDVHEATDLIKYYLKQIAITEEGTLDVDIIDTGYSAKTRSITSKLFDLIDELQKGRDRFPLDEFLQKASEQLDMNSGDIEVQLGKILRDGYLFEPTPGFLKKLS